MNKIKEAFTFLILPVFIFACSSTKERKQPPQLTFDDPILSKRIDYKGTKGIPLDHTSTFSTEDPFNNGILDSLAPMLKKVRLL